MKALLLTLVSVLLIAGQSFSQLKVVEHGTYQFIDGQPVLVEPAGTEDLNGTNIVVEANNLNGDNEHAVWMVNESDTEYVVRAIRTELDVPLGTENNVCWGLCPISTQDAGEMPVWIVGGESAAFTETMMPGDTAISFAFHHEPNGITGCSHYRMDLVNDADQSEILASFELTFDHSPNSACVTSLAELSERLELTLAPNPAQDFINLRMDGLEVPSNVVISDLLGQEVSSRRVAANSNLERINTNEMRNGVYFLSIVAEGQVIRTSKFVVSH